MPTTDSPAWASRPATSSPPGPIPRTTTSTCSVTSPPGGRGAPAVAAHVSEPIAKGRQPRRCSPPANQRESDQRHRRSGDGGLLGVAQVDIKLIHAWRSLFLKSTWALRSAGTKNSTPSVSSASTMPAAHSSRGGELGVGKAGELTGQRYPDLGGDGPGLDRASPRWACRRGPWRPPRSNPSWRIWPRSMPTRGRSRTGPPPLATFTMVPEPRSIMSGSTARFMRMGDMKFVRITTSRSSGV